MKYYTAEELAAASHDLMMKGKPMTDIVNDPKCPPEEREKIKKLLKLSEDSSQEIMVGYKYFFTSEQMHEIMIELNKPRCNKNAVISMLLDGYVKGGAS